MEFGNTGNENLVQGRGLSALDTPPSRSDVGFDFFTARKAGHHPVDIKAFTEIERVRPVLHTFEHYKQQNPDIPEAELIVQYEKIEDEFKHFLLGNFENKASYVEKALTSPDTEAFRAFGGTPLSKSQPQFINLNPNTIYGPGHFSKGVETRSRDEMARRVPFMFNKENNLVPNTWSNRFLGNIGVVENPDPTSPIRYLYKEYDWDERILRENARSVFGAKRAHSRFLANVAPLNAFASSFLGLTGNMVGSILNMAGDTVEQIIDPEGYKIYEQNNLTRLGNSVSNASHMLTHANQDQQQRPFQNWQSFIYNFYNMMGQIAAMGLVTAAAAKGKYPQHATKMGLGFMGLQVAGSTYTTSIEAGASREQAMQMFFTYGAVTYFASMAISANLLQSAAARRVSMMQGKAIKNYGKEWWGSTGSALPQQSIETLAELTGKTAAKNWLNPARAYGRYNAKIREIADKNSFARYALMAGEETAEEFIEEIGHAGLGVIANRDYFVPKARSIVREHEVNQYHYFTETDEFGLPTYYKRSRTGTKIPLEYGVWIEEQNDLAAARNVLDGNLPMDQRITIDEALMAGISSLFGGAGLNMITGANRARNDNDERLLIERLALDVADLRPDKQRKALEDIRATFEAEQRDTNLFGPDNLTADGQIAKAGTESTPAATIAINAFMEDLNLTLELINASGIKNPEALAAMRGSKYLQVEAVAALKQIRALETAIQQKADNQPVTAVPGLFTAESTVEELQTLLTGAKTHFRSIVTPKDGAKGKETSIRYSQIFLENNIIEHLIDKRAEQRATEYLRLTNKNPEYKPDMESTEFIKLRDRYAQQIKENPNEVMMLYWYRDPHKFFEDYEWEGVRPEIYSFLEKGYKGIFGGEMLSVVNDINDGVKQAQRVISSPTILTDLFSRIKSLSRINPLVARDQRMTPEQAQTFNEEINYVRDVLGEFISLRDLSEYSEHLSETSEQYELLHNEIRNQIGRFTEIGTQIEQTRAAYEMNNPLLGHFDFNPSEDAAAQTVNLLNVASQFETLLEQRKKESADYKARIGTNIKHTREIGNIQNESPEIQSDIRKRAFDRFITQTAKANIKTPNTYSLIDYVASIQEKLKGDDPIPNIAQIVDQFTLFIRNLQYIKAIAELNTDFIQALEGENAQHSMLRGKENAHLLFTQEEKNDVVKKVDDLVKQMDAILDSEKMKVHSRDFAQFREMLRHIEIRNFHLKEVAQHFTADEILDSQNQEFRSAYNEIGKKLGDNSTAQYKVWLEQYQDGSSAKTTEKTKIIEHLHEVDALITKAESFLGGKLDNFIKSIMAEIHKDGRELSSISDFIKEPPANFSATKIEGPYSADRFGNTENHKYDHAGRDAYFWSVTNWANNLNRLGITTATGKVIPSIIQIGQAYRNVLVARQKAHETSKDGAINPKAQINTATYVQEKTLLDVIGFMLNPQQDLLKDVALDQQVNNSLLVRAYGGAGKSTQLLMDLYQTIDEITGKSTPVTVVVPSQWLKETHVANFQAIGKTDYNIVYTHDVLNKAVAKTGEVQLNSVVIFDDASIYDTRELLAIRDMLKEKLSIWLGDESQTSDIDYVALQIPIKKSAIERTYPWTEVFRTGNPDHFKIHDYFRAMALGRTETLPKVAYRYDDSGMLEGSRYYEDKTALRESFITEWERTRKEDRIAQNLIFAVPTIADLDDFMSYVVNKFGENVEAIDNIRKLTYLVVYDEKHPDLSVIGLGSNKVFFEFDPEIFTQRVAKNKEFGSLTMQTASDDVKANTGRVGYTGVSRAKAFIGIIADPKSSVVGKIHSLVTDIDPIEKSARRQSTINRLNTIYKGETTPPPQPPPPPQRTVFDRSYQLTDDSRDRVAASKEFINLKEQLLVENRKRAEALEGDKTPYHATDIAFEAVKGRIKTQDPKYHDNARIRNARRAVMTQILRYHFDRSNHTYETIVERVNALNEVYRSINPKHPSLIGQDPAKGSIEGFIMSFYKTIASDLNFTVADPMNIVSPMLLKEDATVVIDGKEQKTSLQASPALFKVVGFDKDANPIVDVLEFRVFEKQEKVSQIPDVYTRAKLAMYSVLAGQGSFLYEGKPTKIKINRVFMSNYVDVGGALEYHGSYPVSDGAITEYISDIEAVYPDIKNSGITSDEIFVDQDAFYNNERTVDDPRVPIKISYYNNASKGPKATRDRVIVTRVTKRIDDKGNVVSNVYFANPERVESSMPMAEFLATYSSASATEALSENDVFNSRAIIHTATNATMSHALVFSPIEAGVTGDFDSLVTHPSYQSRMKFLGSIDLNEPINKRYHATYDGVKIIAGTNKYKSGKFSHVVTNEITDEFLLANEELIRSTLSEAQIEGLEGLSFDEALQVFKDHRFHIISYENEPEAGFGANNSLVTNPSTMGLISEYLRTQQETPEHKDAFEKLEVKIKTSFPSNDAFYSDLVNYNIDKLQKLKAAHDASLRKQTLPGTINSIKLGNIKRGNLYRDALPFVQGMTDRGFSASSPYKVTNQHGRTFFAIDFTRQGIPGEISVEFDAKPADLEYIGTLRTKLNEFINNNPLFRENKEKIDEILSKDVDTLTNKDYELLRALLHEGFTLLEKEPAFQFVAANLSNIKAIDQHISKIALSKKTRTLLAELNFNGILLDHDPKGVSILGRLPYDKARNLNSMMSVLEDIVKSKRKIDGHDIQLRVNPFYIFNLDDVHQDTEEKILVEMLQTKTELIKNPEVYTVTSDVNNNVTSSTKDEDSLPFYKAVAYGPDVDLNEYNSQSFIDALEDINKVIGDAGKKYGIQLKQFNLKGKNGATIYGELSGRIIKLYGKELSGKHAVLNNVGRHEAMHFVMKYLLDRKSYNNIMNEVASELGIEYNAANEITIHEHIADSFMDTSQISKPQTLWQKFIQALKEIANYLGFYSLSYSEMMVAADRGYFSRVSLNPETNFEVEPLYNKRFVSKWAEFESIQNAVNKVGDRSLYEIVKNTYLIPKLKSNMATGKQLRSVPGDPASAVYLTVSNMELWEAKYKLSEFRHTVNGVTKAIKDFTPEDLSFAIRKNMDKAIKERSANILTDREVIMPMLQEIFPNADVDQMVRTGKEIVERTSNENISKTNKSSERIAHVGETETWTAAITDLQELKFSTVPLYKYAMQPISESKTIEFIPSDFVIQDSPELINIINNLVAANPNITPEDLTAELQERGLIEKVCVGASGIIAKDGIRGKFHKGSTWEVVKDLKGYPSHAQGGVDVRIGKDGFSFIRGEGEIKAAHGLVLPALNSFD